MQRWLVTFRSHYAPRLADATLVDVRSTTSLGAIAKAKRECPPFHHWRSATVEAWPIGCETVDDAAALRGRRAS